MISIIGAGPAGSYLAYLLAKEGKEVQVFEEHKKIGSPVQCGGAITSAIKKIDPIFTKQENFIINKIKRAKFFSQSKTLVVKFKNPDLILDRRRFDVYIAKKAQNAGAKIILDSKLVSLQRKNNQWLLGVAQEGTKKRFATDILVGSDGALSKTASLLGIKRNLVLAVQARAKLSKRISGDEYKIWFGDKVAPGFFAWVIPENQKIIRVGLATNNNSATKVHFDRFLKSFDNFGLKIMQMQSGFIPIGKPVCIPKTISNAYLIGDAASHAKATTGGGIVPALLAAKTLALSLVKNQNYEKNIASLNKNLLTNYIIRKILTRFSDNDYDRLLNIVSKPSIKKVVETYNRDEISELKRNLLKISQIKSFFKAFVKSIVLSPSKRM